MKLDNLDSRCFLCGVKKSGFDTETRICGCVQPQGFPEKELTCYVTILPEPLDYSASDLPSIWDAQPKDAFAAAAGDLGLHLEAAECPTKTVSPSCRFLPYGTDLLHDQHHLRCGNATIYRALALEDVTGSDLVLVLDMGSYYGSGTLKDPRSWAIINTALSQGITDLALWTAGNAGISLAKLAYFANRRLAPTQRMQIHAIVDDDVAPEIRAQLRLWQSEVLDLFRQDRPVLNPQEIRSLVGTRLRRSRRVLDDNSYWHVTDGWDGVGLLMYRLIAAQVIRDLLAPGKNQHCQPLDVVLPVGTGNLLLGFYLGLRDCEQANLIPAGSCRLIGILPAGSNILNNVRHRSIPKDDGSSANTAAPVMPKLKSLYTPLAPCLARIEQEGRVEFLIVTAANQLRAGRQILSSGIDDGIVAEPSALATFAALPQLGNHDRRRIDNERLDRCGRRTLVVNSGFGLLGGSEQELLHHAIGV
jgi:hypothetical protein